MFERAKIIFIILFISVDIILGQNDSLKNIGYFLDNVINTAAIEEENSQLYDLIEQYIENPICINDVDKTALMKLPFVTLEIANEIINYQIKFGKIFSYSELKLNTNLSDKTIKILEAFTCIEKRETKNSISYLQNFNVKLRSRILYNLQESEGYKIGFYDGSRSKIYNRIKVTDNSKLDFGGLIEKDAGEKSYFDFYSFYLQIKNIVKGLKLLGGYYTMEFGQGLAMWSPYSFSKSSDATNSVIKRAREISPYTSAGEYLFMNGAAAEYSTNYFYLSSFYSTDNDNISSYSNSTWGISTRITPIKNITLSFLHYQYNAKTVSESDKKEEHFSFAYNIGYKNLFVTGEFALFKNSLARINTLQLSLLRTFLLVASIRNYDNDYKSHYGQGFGESNLLRNEFGIHLGFKWKTKVGIINFYLDQFKFPNPTSTIPLPSNGNELSVSFQTSPLRNTNIYFRYFSENKEAMELIANENKIVNRRTNKLRCELLNKVDKNLQLKSRIEFLLLKGGLSNENGILLFQDIRYNFNNTFTFYGRIIFFETDSFASRIYEFENDLSGVMTNQPLWGKGVKWYLLVKYNPFKRFSLSAKYSELYKPNEKFLGSGYNLIEGNIDDKISLQIDYSF